MIWQSRRQRGLLGIAPRPPIRLGGRSAFHASIEGPPSDGQGTRPSGWRLTSGERRYTPPGGPGLCRGALRKVRKSLASRYYQLLSGHAAIGSFLHERMTGPQRLESNACRWLTAGRGSRATICSRSAARGAPRSGDCRRGLGKTASGSTQWHHQLGGCGKRRPRRLF